MKKLHFLIQTGILGIVFLLATAQTQAAISVVHTATASSGSGNTATATLTSTTAGNLLVIAVGYGDSSAETPTFTDNGSPHNTYTLIAEANVANNSFSRCQIWYAKNTTGGITSLAVAGSASSASPRICVYEISGADPVAPLDGFSSLSGQSGATSISMTANSGDIVIATGSGQTPPNGVSSPFSPLDYQVTYPLTHSDGFACAHDIVSSSGSITATFSSTGNGFCTAIAAFKLVLPTVTLASSQNPSLAGGAVTFSATVAGSVGTPTGTVTFKDGATTLGTGTLNASGIAYFGIGTLTAGTHSITAFYAGDSNYSTNTSSALSQNNTGPITVTVNNPSFESQVLGDSGSANNTPPTSWSSTGPSTTYGVLNPNNTYINGAGVNTLPSPGDGANVAYIDTMNTIGSKAIYQGVGSIGQSGNYMLTLAVADRFDNVSSGQPLVQLLAGSTFASATVLTPTSSTTPDPNSTKGTLVTWTLNYTLTAGQSIWIELTNKYTGGNTEVDFDNVQFYGGNPSTTALASSQNPSLTGGAVTFTATVTGSGGTPTGTVVFMDGTNTLGTGSLNASGVANFSTAALSTGTHSITAVYGGDSTFCGSASSTLSQTVGAVGFTINNPGFENNASGPYTAGAPPAVSGSSYSSTVAYQWSAYNAGGSSDDIGIWAPATQGGTVLSGYGGNNVGVTENNNQNGPQYLYQDIGSLSGHAGHYQLTLLVGTDNRFFGAGGGNPIIELALGASGIQNPSSFTSLIAPDSRTGNNLTGANVNVMQSWTLNFTVPTGSSGDVYLVLENAQGASATSIDYDNLSLAGGISTTTTLTSSQNPQLPGQSVTFTATVKTNGVTPGDATGTVTFMDGIATLGTGAVNGSGVATFSTSALSHGTHSITAAYGGGGIYGGSISSPLSQVIDTPPKSATHFYGTPENTDLVITASTLAGLDYDADGDPLTITAVTSPSAHSVSVTLSSGTITYHPGVNNYVGPDTFTYTVSDGYTGGTANNTVSVTVRLATGATSSLNPPSASSGTINLSGYGIPGRQYDIQKSSDPSFTSPSVVATVTAGSNGFIFYTDNPTSTTYYRLAVH